jgi:tripartite-type tricarboxylate transporter receptor subunit TctC
MDKRAFLILSTAGAAAAGLAPLASAQALKDYPTRPIRMVSPFAAGSTSDTSARFVADQLSRALGQPVTVENLPGADGRLGMMAAKNAPADGYTLVMGSWTNLSVNPVLVKDLPYDPLKDFKPVAGIGRSMLGIVVPAKSPYKSFDDLIAAAKARPKAINFANFAAGYRLATEWFSSLAGVEFTHVPYRSTSQMNTDIAGGNVDVGMDGVTSLTPMIKSGQLRLLAVTGEVRHPEFPEVPAIKETYGSFAVYGWSALMARAEVRDDIVKLLADAMSRTMASDDAAVFAKRVGSELLQRGPDEMRKFQVAQIETFRKVAAQAGLKPE